MHKIIVYSTTTTYLELNDEKSFLKWLLVRRHAFSLYTLDIVMLHHLTCRGTSAPSSAFMSDRSTLPSPPHPVLQKACGHVLKQSNLFSLSFCNTETMLLKSKKRWGESRTYLAESWWSVSCRLTCRRSSWSHTVPPRVWCSSSWQGCPPDAWRQDSPSGPGQLWHHRVPSQAPGLLLPGMWFSDHLSYLQWGTLHVSPDQHIVNIWQWLMASVLSLSVILEAIKIKLKCVFIT